MHCEVASTISCCLYVHFYGMQISFWGYPHSVFTRMLKFWDCKFRLHVINISVSIRASKFYNYTFRFEHGSISLTRMFKFQNYTFRCRHISISVSKQTLKSQHCLFRCKITNVLLSPRVFNFRILRFAGKKTALEFVNLYPNFIIVNFAQKGINISVSACTLGCGNYNLLLGHAIIPFLNECTTLKNENSCQRCYDFVCTCFLKFKIVRFAITNNIGMPAMVLKYYNHSFSACATKIFWC